MPPCLHPRHSALPVLFGTPATGRSGTRPRVPGSGLPPIPVSEIYVQRHDRQGCTVGRAAVNWGEERQGPMTIEAMTIYEGGDTRPAPLVGPGCRRTHVGVRRSAPRPSTTRPPCGTSPNPGSSTSARRAAPSPPHPGALPPLPPRPRPRPAPLPLPHRGHARSLEAEGPAAPLAHGRRPLPLRRPAQRQGRRGLPLQGRPRRRGPRALPRRGPRRHPAPLGLRAGPGA